MGPKLKNCTVWLGRHINLAGIHAHVLVRATVMEEVEAGHGSKCQCWVRQGGGAGPGRAVFRLHNSR